MNYFTKNNNLKNTFQKSLIFSKTQLENNVIMNLVTETIFGKIIDSVPGQP